MFSRLFIAASSRKMDMDEFFKHENPSGQTRYFSLDVFALSMKFKIQQVLLHQYNGIFSVKSGVSYAKKPSSFNVNEKATISTILDDT